MCVPHVPYIIYFNTPNTSYGQYMIHMYGRIIVYDIFQTYLRFCGRMYNNNNNMNDNTYNVQRITNINIAVVTDECVLKYFIMRSQYVSVRP
jgi:aspartyl aminopeptidase